MSQDTKETHNPEGALRLRMEDGAAPMRLKASGGQREYIARFVRAGRARAAGNKPSNIHIEAAALEQAAREGQFDNKAIFVDHAGWFEHPSLERLVGVTRESSFDPESRSVIGTLRLYSTPSGRVAAQLIDEILADAQSTPDVGLSIVFYPVWAEPQKDNRERSIVGIEHVESVDLVFEPAADGRILQALSTAKVSNSYQGEKIIMSDQPVTQATFVQTQHAASQQAASQQATSQQAASQQAASQQAASQPNQSHEQTSADRWANATADIATLALINASGLPQVAREKLVNQFSAHPAADPQEVNAAIETERGYLAALQQDNVIQIGGQPPRSPRIVNMLTSLDRILEATEAMFEGRRPKNGIQPLTGIRELYHMLSGDYEMTGVFQADRIQFANVTSSTMANLVANVLNKRVMQEFQEYPHWWEPIVIQEDFQNLQQVKWITLGGVGELPTVDEGAAYTELTWDDGAETSTFVKKGGYLGLTIEAIDKDDTGRVRAAPRALAQAAWLTLAKAISAIFTANSGVGPTMSDSVALFDAGHSNLGSTALSITTFNAARLAMRKQAELNSSERLGALTAPRFLLVPPDLEVTALQVLASEYNYLYALSNGVAAPINDNAEGDSFNARMALAKNRVIVVDLWTDANDWAACADPRLYPTIGLGFRYGRAPEVFSVASPTAGLMFTNDTMPVKVRFFFAVGPIDYRGLYKANVS